MHRDRSMGSLGDLHWRHTGGSLSLIWDESPSSILWYHPGRNLEWVITVWLVFTSRLCTWNFWRAGGRITVFSLVHPWSRMVIVKSFSVLLACPFSGPCTREKSFCSFVVIVLLLFCFLVCTYWYFWFGALTRTQPLKSDIYEAEGSPERSPLSSGPEDLVYPFLSTFIMTLKEQTNKHTNKNRKKPKNIKNRVSSIR